METEVIKIKKEIMGLLNNIDNIKILKYTKLILIGSAKKTRE